MIDRFGAWLLLWEAAAAACSVVGVKALVKWQALVKRQALVRREVSVGRRVSAREKVLFVV